MWGRLSGRFPADTIEGEIGKNTGMNSAASVAKLVLLKSLLKNAEKSFFRG